MNNVLRMGKKVFTVSVVVTTIAWSIGLAALLMPLAAGAATLSSGDLIKASQPAVYYYGADGKRYVFPNEKTYFTWYTDFSGVKKITDAELAAISIGGNVTYKPGVKLVKITTDPKVYAVDANGTLRWVNSETLAGALYGGTWAKQIDDIPDAFFVNYKTGGDIALTTEFVKATVMAAATSINVDKGLASAATGGTGALSFALDAANFPAAAIVASPATTGQTVGQRRAPMLKVAFSAGTADVKVTTLKFKRGGISKDGDVDNMYLAEGKNVFAEAQSVSDGIAVLTDSAGLFTVSANTTKVIDVLMDVNKDMSSGSTMTWSLASADVTSNAATVSGSVVGNTMTAAVVTDLGALKVDHVSYPSSVDPGTLSKEMWRVTFEARSQDMLLTYAKFNNLGSSYDSDIQNIKLMDAATQLNGVVAQVKDKVVEFDLSGMTGGGYKILAGSSKQLTLVGDIIGGTNRTFQWSIQKQQDIRATDLEYNVQAFVDSGTAGTFGVEKATVATTINHGSLSMGLASDSPNTNISDGGTNLVLAKYNFKATGEDVKVTALTVVCSASTATNDLVNTLIKLDGVQVGTTDATMNCGLQTDEATYSFGNSFIVPADGKNHTVEIVGDLTATAWAAEDTIYVGFGGAGAAQGKTSLESLDADVSDINGQNLTLKGPGVTAMMDMSFTDRSATFPTGVANSQNAKVASFVIIAGQGEAADISQIILGDNATYAGGGAFQNLVLKDRDGNQIGTTISSLTADGTDSTYTFTPATAIRLAAGEQKAFDLYADIKGTITSGYASAAVNVFEIDDITATGVVTATSASYAPATHIALQKIYIALHGNLTVDESADTAIAQQLVLGSTGQELAKFKLSASGVEDITVTKFIIADDMSSAFPTGLNERATGSLKNFKLYNGTTLLAGVSSLDATHNSLTPYATFSGFTLTVPKNQNVTLTVKADLASYDDGGAPSSTHRILVLKDYKLTDAVETDSVVAVGAGSGMSMSKDALDINGSTATSNTDADVRGNHMDLVRAKLTFAHAADTPSGATSAGVEQTVAKFVASNSANVGNYSLTISKMNFAVSSSGNSIASASTFNVYKDSVSTGNLLVTTDFGDWTVPSGYTQGYYWDTYLGNLTTSLEVAAGSSKTIVVTLETSVGGWTTGDTLSVGLAANDVKWVDGGTTGSGATATYYSCDSLPLTGKTLVY